MSSIVRQEQTADRLLVVVGDGREWICDKEKVQDFYRSTQGQGNAAARREATIALVKADMVAALGAESIDPDEFFADFDVLTGGWKTVEWVFK